MTARALEILKIMLDTGEELVYERGAAYVGLERTSRAVVLELQRAMAIRLDQFSKIGNFERYTINETGRELLTPTELTHSSNCASRTGQTCDCEER